MEKRHRHHVIPRHLGGSDDPSNLELIDPVKHAEIHALRFIAGEDRWFCAMQEGWPLLDSSLQEEVRKVMSERNLMKDKEIALKANRNDERRQKQRERMTSNNPMKQPEVAAKVSAARKGKPSNRKGAVLSDDTKEKLRQAATGYKHSEEAKAKMSASRTGKKRGPYKKKNAN